MTVQTRTQQLSAESHRTLLEIARDSIRNGLDTGRALDLSGRSFEPELLRKQASFVTLNRFGALRGCIGHLEAVMPLAEDVVENAFAAAFHDPRFPPLSRAEFSELEIHISVLTPSEPMAFDSQADLLRQIRPEIDGLILAEGRARGTFLPAVWESLPRPEDFLRHLKMKAGLPADYWSDTLKVYRYETESFPD